MPVAPSVGPWDQELAVARAAAEAAVAVLPPPGAAPAATAKADGSPVTAADLAANARILAVLRSAVPADAILSEELADDPARLRAHRVWIVDPLDGTRDFVAGSGDYAVHVALAVEGVPVVAAVAWPADGALYTAVRGGGALRHDAQGTHPLSVAPARPLAQYRTGITRTAMHPALERFLARGGLAAAAVPRGASIKHLLLAAGALDCCVTLHGGEHEWDTAAPGLIVTEAGGTVTDADGVPFRYNQPDVRHHRGVLLSAGHHHAALAALAGECWGS